MICGRTLDQIRGEAIEDYLRNTRRVNETPAMREMKKHAFIAGMGMGTLLFIPAGLWQAAACDGVLYTITRPKCTETAQFWHIPYQVKRLPNTKTLKEDEFVNC